MPTHVMPPDYGPDDIEVCRIRHKDGTQVALYLDPSTITHASVSTSRDPIETPGPGYSIRRDPSPFMDVTVTYRVKVTERQPEWRPVPAAEQPAVEVPADVSREAFAAAVAAHGVVTAAVTWQQGDRVVCVPDVGHQYPGTVTGFTSWGQPLVKWDHWHKPIAYSPDQLTHHPAAAPVGKPNRLPDTKAELIATLARFPDDTLIGVAGAHGQLLPLEIDNGMIVTVSEPGPARDYVMFSERPSDEDEDELDEDGGQAT
jgi:hypothetical protein